MQYPNLPSAICNSEELPVPVPPDKVTLSEYEYNDEDAESTAVEQVVACALVTQRARVRSPVILGEVFFGVFPHECQEALGPQGPRISFGHHYHPSSFH